MNIPVLCCNRSPSVGIFMLFFFFLFNKTNFATLYSTPGQDFKTLIINTEKLKGMN